MIKYTFAEAHHTMAEISGSKLLNKEECFEIVENDLKLKHLDDFTLESFRIIKCSNDLIGFMGEYYKLLVDIKEKNKEEVQHLSYFVKSIPLENELYRNECERKGFFTKEAKIYEKILPNIQRYATKPLYPKSYLTRKDLIVMEDFSLAEKSLKLLDEGEEYSLQHYQLFLQHLAELHAASLAWELKENMDIGQKFKDILYELQLTTNNEWYITGIKSVLYLAQQHPKYQYAEALQFINQKLYNIFLNMEDFTKPSLTLRNVLCHRDSWDRNIFWQYNSSNIAIACRIVDFQLTRYSPPAIDVLYFLYNNFESPQQRIQLLPTLLQYYHESLMRTLKNLNLPLDLIPKSDFDKDCQRALLPVLTLRAICAPLMKLPKGWSQTIRDTEPEKMDYYMNTDRSEMFTRVSKIDALYMDKILRPVQEIMEYFDFKPQQCCQN